jgi:N4-gp56 family major capsid protein
MTDTTASDSTISTMIGNYYDHVFLERLEANLVYDKYGVQRPLPENMGDTIVWHALQNPSQGYDLPDGSIPGASAVSARKVSAQISWKADLRSVTDRVVATAVCPVVEEVVQAMGYSAALTVDHFISDKIGFGSAASTGVTNAASVTYPSVFSQGFPVIDGNSGIVYWPSSSTGIATSLQNGFFSTIGAIAHVRKAVTQLKTLNAMPFDDKNYRGVVHPTVSDNVRSDSLFVSWMAYTNLPALEKGQLGVIERVLFDESSEAFTVDVKASTWSTVYASLGGTLYGTLIFGKGAYGVTKLGGKDVRVSVVTGADKSDPLNQRTLVGYKIPIAAKILNPSAGIILAYFKGN